MHREGKVFALQTWESRCLRGLFPHRRQGGEDASIKVQLELDSQPKVNALKDELAQFMRCKSSTRIPMLQALSTYFKMHNLQVCASFYLFATLPI